MVGSHADEVEGGEAVVQSLCEAMVQAMHTELGQYHAAQEHERAELESLAVRGEEAEQPRCLLGATASWGLGPAQQRGPVQCESDAP